jgi:hypothetical protein
LHSFNAKWLQINNFNRVEFSRNKAVLQREWCHNKAIHQGQLPNMWSVKIKLIIGFLWWVTTVTVTGQRLQCKFWIHFPVHRNFWHLLYKQKTLQISPCLALFCFVLNRISPQLLQNSPREKTASIHHLMLLRPLDFLCLIDAVCFPPFPCSSCFTCLRMKLWLHYQNIQTSKTEKESSPVIAVGAWQESRGTYLSSVPFFNAFRGFPSSHQFPQPRIQSSSYSALEVHSKFAPVTPKLLFHKIPSVSWVVTLPASQKKICWSSTPSISNCDCIWK